MQNQPIDLEVLPRIQTAREGQREQSRKHSLRYVLRIHLHGLLTLYLKQAKLANSPKLRHNISCRLQSGVSLLCFAMNIGVLLLLKAAQVQN